MNDTTSGPPGRAIPLRRRAATALPCIVFIVICSLCLNETMLYSPDSVNYLGWAHSLSRLEGFRNSMGPEPERYVFNAPLYPLLLAPAALAFPLSIPAAKLVTMLAGVVTLAAFQLFLSRKVPAGAALGAALFLAVNPLFVLYSTQVLSDIPFAACCVIVMLLLERLLPPREADARGTLYLIAALTASVFLREVGIALVFAAGTILLLRGRTRVLLLLLITVSLAYGLWYLRNEIVVARAENPGLRNLSLFFSHVYTESAASPFAEAAARLSRSATFYGGALLSILTAPFNAGWTYSVTDSTDPVFRAVLSFTSAARWPLALVSAIPVALGVRRIVCDRVQGPFLAALIPAYGAIIALYPVSDIRFLFPAVLLLLWGAAAGIAETFGLLKRKGDGRLWGGVLTALVLLLAVPDLAWIRNVIATNLAYRSNPEEFVSLHAKNDPYPDELMLIPRRAAVWIAAESPRGTVVGSKIKAAALWLEGRPLLVLNPLIPMEEFDNRIRDYGIRYLVCELQAHQIPDFALQMALSLRHTFTPVFAFGDVRVYRVGEKADIRQPSLVAPPGGYGAVEAAFLQGVYALAYGGEQQALTTFRAMERVPGAETSSLFYEAIAREFAMDLDTAGVLFARFRTIPQSAAYLRQAQVHENIIALLRDAAADPPGEEKAAKYQEAAMSYWILGFRTQGVTMLREALRLDPGYFSGEVFGAVFSLALGDTAGAREGVKLAERARPTDPLTGSLRSIMASIDSLRSPARSGTMEIAIGRQYVSMGLYEMGIDQAVKALRDGEDPDALRLLSGIYVRKDRHAPAIAALRRLVRTAPGDTAAAADLRKYTLLWE
jgi:4-amino-4-deoxy-L-arabinose transferase-like glycosyltransferase/tetratricopeptide (TPR) repeat protein